MAQYFIGRQDRGTVEVTYDGGRGHLSCQITDRWRNLDTTSSACGSPVEYSVTKRIGITESHSHVVEGTIESSLGIQKLAELKSKISEKTETAVRWEVVEEEKKTYSFTPPECGRQTNAVYQLVREFDLVNERVRRFRRRDSWNVTIIEFLRFFDVRPNIEPWAPECNCDGPPDSDFDGTFNLDLGTASLQVCYRVIDNEVELNFAGREASIEIADERRLSVSVQTAILPEVVRWLGDLEDEYVEGNLIPYVQSPPTLFQEFEPFADRLRFRWEGEAMRGAARTYETED